MRRRDKLKNIDSANLLAEQRYLKSKGLLKENSVTQALMGAANSGNLGGGIYDIVKNFGKNAVLAALQALMGSGDIDPQGVKNIGLIQTIQKLQENVTEDEGSQGGSTESTNWDEVLTRNLTDPSSDLFTFDFNGKRTTLRVTRVNKISFDNIKFLHIDVQLEPNNIVGDTKTIVVGKNAKDVFLPSKGNTGELELVGNSKSWLSAVRQNMLKQKSQQQDDTINESGMAHAAGFADGGSGFEEGATMMQDIDEDAVDTLQQIMQEPIGSFAPKFKSIASDPKVQAVLKAGLKDGDENDEKTNLSPIVAVATQLRPTQNIIGTNESLDNILDDKYGSLSSFLEGKAKFPTPIITLNGKYIIDGHHRWSQAYAANPKVQIQCNDIKLNLEPTEVLKVLHMALAAAKGDIDLSTASGNNMLDAGEEQIKQIVTQKLKPEVGKIYQQFNKGNSTEEIANYIWNNVQMMQSNNTPVDGAPDRSAMPQTDDSGYDKLLGKGVVNFKNPKASDVGGDQQQGNAIEDAEVVAEQRYLESKGAVNKSGIKKSSKRIKITESQRRLLESKGLLKEDSDTYFETLSATLDHVREMAKEMGYELDEDDVNFQFGTGGIPYGQTKSATIPLLKDGEPIMGKSGKPLNRAIRVSIYRMDSGRYELTAYKTF